MTKTKILARAMHNKELAIQCDKCYAISSFLEEEFQIVAGFFWPIGRAA